MFLLTGVVYTYFKMNANATVFRMNGLRASVAAEAGVALAVHYLSTLQTMPESMDPFLLEMEGDSAGWITFAEGEGFKVVIDPVNIAGGRLSNGAVEIRARGLAGNETRDLFVRAAPAYPSSYSLLTCDGIPQGFLTDGCVLNGPVHSNGTVTFSSSTADSTDDPFVEMVSTTSEGGFYFAGSGRSEVPHPAGSSVWVRPYSRHIQGAPWWRNTAPAVDFQRMREHFSSLISSGGGSQVVTVAAERVLIDGNTLICRESENSQDFSVDISQADVVILRNGFAPVMIKSVGIPDRQVTLLAANDLLIGGSIDGGAVSAGGLLGLVAMGDVIIAADPDETGDSDWRGMWQIETDHALLLRTSVVIPAGELRAEIPYLPDEASRITINGSLTQKSMGRLSSAGSGYQLGISWDEGLGVKHPPGFPMLGSWNIYSWLTDPPEREDSSMEDDLV